MKTLYVSDLDGTLLDSSVSVSRESVEMLNRAIAAGACFSVATARTPATLAHLLRDIRLRLPLVVMTGAALWQRDSDTFSNVCHFPPEKVGEILGVYRRYSLPTFIYTLREGRLHIYHQGPLSDYERNFIFERVNSPYKRFHIADRRLASLFPEHPEFADSAGARVPDTISDAVLFFGMQQAAPDHPAYKALRDISGINPIIYPDANTPEITMIEAFPGNASKANGIRLLREATGADRVVVFGDNLNDLTMFEVADTAVAVDNALPVVKEAADIVIGSHDDNSVARFILEETMRDAASPMAAQF